MQLTRAADYAVRVMIHLAGHLSGARTTRDELAASGDVPGHFLSKILQALSRSGLINSHRGVAGGYVLARPAEAITLLEVIEALEGPIMLNVCLAAGPSCDRKSWCSVHRVWAEAQSALTGVLRAYTLAELAKEAAENQTRCGGAEWK
jgi:Rrf2 family iron-sulfur cluster assembly transcriptional regulator